MKVLDKKKIEESDKLLSPYFNPFEIQMLKTGGLYEKVLNFGDKMSKLEK